MIGGIFLHTKGYVVKYLLTNSAATEQRIKDCIWDTIRFADSNWKIVFTFSGHGDLYSYPDGSYLACYDSSTGTTGNLRDTELKNIFSGYAGKLFIFLDACHSGGMDEVVTEDVHKVNRYMTTACTALGVSNEWEGFGNGVWTYEFMERGLWCGQSGHQDMEGNFQWARQQQINWLRNYGDDNPNNYAQQFDGDPNTSFYL